MQSTSVIFMVCILFYVQVSASLSRQIIKLGLGTSFVEFAIDQPIENFQFLASLRIGTNLSFNNFGHLETLQQEMHNFFIVLGNHPEIAAQAAQILYEIVQSNLSELQAQTAWVVLRACQPTCLYDIPRWHTDGYFYRLVPGALYKIVYTFQGPDTLFIEVDDQTRLQFFTLQSQLFTSMNSVAIKNVSMQQLQKIRMQTRTTLADLVQNFLPYQIQDGHGVVFIVGDTKLSAIHSEPAIDQDRLFMSVVPGTYDRIKSLDAQWHGLKVEK